MRKALVLLYLLLTSAAYAQSTYEAWAAKACGHIAKVYSTCSKDFIYESGRFSFPKLGTNTLCSDGAQRKFYDRINNMDVASMLAIPYTSGNTPLPEARQNHDPGRLRAEELFKAVYGNDEATVWTNLIRIDFLGNTVWFQKKMGAAVALQKVSRELQVLISQDATVANFLAGVVAQVEKPQTMNWRFVKGTNRLSTHSFGTGVDIVIKSINAQYWLWDEAVRNPVKAKQGEVAFEADHFIPAKTPYFHPKVVEVFERNGFIWGGKWNHYDTMHFEYRPEFFGGYKINCQ